MSSEFTIDSNSKGLRKSDITTYENLPYGNQYKARKRANKVMNNLVLDRVETSILPKDLLLSIYRKVDKNYRLLYELITWSSFNGTHFKLIRKFPD